MLPKKSAKELREILGKVAVRVSLSDTEINDMGLAVVRFVLAIEASKIKGRE